MTRSIPPSVTFPSPNEWPNSLRTITNITNEARAVVTSHDHGFTASDIGITIVDFLEVKGMLQINGLPGTIIDVIDTDNFRVSVNTTTFDSYASGGFANIVAGQFPYDPFTNIG